MGVLEFGRGTQIGRVGEGGGWVGLIRNVETLKYKDVP